MKIKFLLLVVISIAFANTTKAQCPHAFNYQTVVRDASGAAMPNRNVTFRFTIQNSINPGTPVYAETFSAITNPFGLVTLQVGTGTPVSGSLAAIDWTTGQKYMRVEIDATGGSNYTNMGTEIWGSVPYALYADSARKGGYPKHYIGEYYGGGIVFYVTDNGQHGLIADSTDLQPGVNSEAWVEVDTFLCNAVLTGIGGGNSNTERIIVKQGAGNYAAQLCANYTGGGYGDWFLPSINELALLYNQQQVVGGFTNTSAYWSSTEVNYTTATTISFTTGVATDTVKSSANNVRAIRVF